MAAWQAAGRMRVGRLNEQGKFVKIRVVVAAFAALGLVGGCAPLTAVERSTAAVTPVEIGVQATPTREARVLVYAPTRPKGVILFSHAASASPDRYQLLFARLNAKGYAVLAPLHVDSRSHPDTGRYTLQTAFGERIADMAAVAQLAGTRFPRLPAAAMGHSYGALLAQMQGGALRYVADARAPAVRAVVSFSSPGNIPGLIQPPAYTTLAVPTLMVTGTADTVPGFVTNWEDHLRAFREAPAGGRYALTLPGGDHYAIIGGDLQRFERAVAATVAFLDAHLLGDEAARRRLAAIGLDRR